VIIALVRMNNLTPEIEDALLCGLEDPYYEVRAEGRMRRLFSAKNSRLPND